MKTLEQNNMNINNYFTWNDSWVFTTLYYTTKNKTKIDLPNFIATGDYLNHSIFDKDEVITGLIKLQKRGVIQIIEEKIIYTKIGNEIINNSKKTKGGLFSRVDVSLKKLNSKKIKLSIVDEINSCDFITETIYKNSVKKYQKLADKIISKIIKT